ncbi:26S proteasome non-ATPase regulatory subunit 5 [Diachasma alloeum]|uniref:26S proteasome non-ATPase regulatory subunit 5 n=1 Tax=Diachasma alloeum TaxID=454923 RepID=UPI0007383749|nr:26S proteasome non-ATPase regulatory subunit 5 [Diachasma alloeum]
MTVEWCERKINHLSELNDDEEKKQVMEELFIKLSSLTSMELENTAWNVDLGRLFSQLTSNSSIYIEQVCKTLTILFGALEPGNVHKRYPLEIYEYLSHPYSDVKIVVLKELNKISSDCDQVVHLTKNDVKLVIRLIETIGDEDLKVAIIAMDTIKKMARIPEVTNIIYTGNMLTTFARLISKNDVTTFRVYEVIVDIAKSSKEALEVSINSGFLTSLLQVLDSDDVLLQLNALEAMTELASTEGGLNYIEERDVLNKLTDQIARANENPLSNVLIPGLMKFFGYVAKNRPDKIFSKYPIVIYSLFQVIEGDDFVLLANALDTLGHIAQSVEGKYALESLGDVMPRVMERIGGIIDKLPTELRLRGLENLVLIIHIDKSKQDNRILSLTKSWFDMLHDEPLKFIVNLCKQPFADIRYSSMQVLQEIASQTWGQEYTATLPGLIEFLLDRSAETFSNCKKIKYQIVKNLCEATCDIFDSATLQQLQLFVRQGPFYVDLDAEVVTESTS